MKYYFHIHRSKRSVFLLSIIVLSTSFTWNSDKETSSLWDSGIIRHDTEIEKYRKIGKDINFDCVGRYSISEEGEEYAAGVLISPSWVLTASHFPQDSSLWLFGDTFYKTKRILRHPKLKTLAEGRKMQWDGWDLALVELDKPVLDIKPASRYSGQAERGMIITKIGYGYLGNGQSGMNTPLKQERLGGKNTIDRIGGRVNEIELGPDALLCDFDSPDTNSPNHFGSADPLEFEIGGSKGDSGGGVFSKQNGEWKLVGIVSGGMSRDVKYGAIMNLARVSSANLWIEGVLSGSDKK